MRYKTKKYKQVFVIATDKETGERVVCHQGTTLTEAKETVKTLRQIDREDGMSMWKYHIEYEDKEGERVRYRKSEYYN